MDAVDRLSRDAARARRENRLTDAHCGYSEAVALSRKGDSPKRLIGALKGLGQIERDLGRVDRARVLYEEAVEICRAEGDALTLAHTLRHLGDVHRDAGALELTGPCYDEALALYRREANASLLDLANALRSAALLETELGHVESATRLWEEARDLYAGAGVEAGVGECSDRLHGLER